MTVNLQESAATLEEMISRVLAATSQKGGVTKTTTTAQYAAECARFGLRVLLLDNDSGRSMSVLTGTAQSTGRLPNESVIEYNARIAPIRAASMEGFVAENGANGRDAVQVASEWWQPTPDLAWRLGGQLLEGGCVHVIPSPGQFLQDVADQPHGIPALRLRNALLQSELWREYDLILIDSNPSSGRLTQMAIAAAGWVLFPVEPELLGTVGYQQGVDVVVRFATEFQHPLSIAGTVMAKMDRTNEHQTSFRDTVAWVNKTNPAESYGYEDDDPRAQFAGGVWAPPIPRAALVPRANGAAVPVYRQLESLFTKSGDPQMGKEKDLAVVATYVKHALNVTALCVPDKYYTVEDALRETEMPDVMRQTIFETPGRIETEGE